MAGEHMAGAEDDDVQFMRTVNQLFCFSGKRNSYEISCGFLGRSSLFKLCTCLRCKAYGFIWWSLRKSNVLPRRYIKWGRKKIFDDRNPWTFLYIIISLFVPCHAFVFFLFFLACYVILSCLIVCIPGDK